ncbi:MAG: sodium:solute symporter [Bacteroidales bacterium]|nr:sodium:solute symporter [Bacteroidales bacterium]MCF8327688.1 sodium:solute symporter [Bacteroidales bacterium]
MSPNSILITFIVYTILLLLISWLTSRKANNESFFIGNRQSPWFVVAYGMIGASLSGVTFISIPGDVGSSFSTYMMIVFGYLVGYAVIAEVLLPLYYRLKLTSIYTFLEQRLGFWSYKTGAFYFILSRVIGASFRMFLVVNVMQLFVFNEWGVPFWVTVIAFIILMVLYTYRGGIKTIVWTDTLQTTFMLATVVVSIVLLGKEMNLGAGEMIKTIAESKYSTVLIAEWEHRYFFLKQFISGAFIAIVMTGLDQDMMQKNLSCRNLKDAKKNIYSMSFALIPMNILILSLGVLLYVYAEANGIHVPETTDDLFPLIALKYLGSFAGIVFLIGLISAAYSSADSALTSLTTSFSIDFLRLDKNEKLTEKQKINLRQLIHIGVATTVTIVIIVFNAINDSSVISKLFTIAGYTYGPLLGMFTFGIYTKRNLNDKFVPLIAILSPVICYIISSNSSTWFYGYEFGFELLLLNGLFVFLGLMIISRK